MDVSGFQKDIEWLLDHVTPQETAEVQDLEVPGSYAIIPLMPLQETELPQREPLREPLNIVVASCDHTDEDAADNGTLETEPSLQDYFTESLCAKETSDSTEEARIRLNTAQRVWKTPDNDSPTSIRSPKGENATTAERTKKRPPKSAAATAEDGMSAFYSRPGVEVQFKRRKKYGPERKEEVNAVRKVGACIRCKLQKKSLLRRGQREVTVLHTSSPKETIYISPTGTARNAAAIEVSVLQAHFVERVWDSDTAKCETRQKQGYTLAPDALPSHASLERWALECGRQTYARPWIAFSECYSQHNLPQVSVSSALRKALLIKEQKCSLLRSAVLFWSLKALLKRCYFILDKPQGTVRHICQEGSGEWFVAPIAVQVQLNNILSRLVDRVEWELLKKLQRAVLDKSSSNRDGVPALFLSMWILGHTYAFFAAVATTYQNWEEKEFFDNMNR
ncbi:hypothetical protein GP486_001110, partial [Trichoglossum hirsutum]